MERKKLSLIIAIAMGLVAIFLVNRYLAQVEQKNPASSQEVVNVFVAAQRIPAGTKINKTMVATKKVPLEFVQPGAVSSIESALGKTAVIDIAAGEQILSSKFSDSISKGPGSTLAMKTPFGKRAITISVDALSAVGGMVRPGDYIDIIGNFPFPQIVGGKAETQIVTVMLFQNVLVLAVGSQIEEQSDVEGDRRVSSASTVTLALIPREAELITYAQQQGRLKLILRSPLDSNLETVPITSMDTLLQYIFSQQGMDFNSLSQQAEPGSAIAEENRVIEIYRGGEKE